MGDHGEGVEEFGGAAVDGEPDGDHALGWLQGIEEEVGGAAGADQQPPQHEEGEIPDADEVPDEWVDWVEEGEEFDDEPPPQHEEDQVPVFDTAEALQRALLAFFTLRPKSFKKHYTACHRQIMRKKSRLTECTYCNNWFATLASYYEHKAIFHPNQR